MFYVLTVIICSALIIAVNCLIPDIYNYFGIFQIILAVLIAVIGEIIIDGIFAFIGRRLLPKKWFTVNKNFGASKKESRFYEKIGIKKWKDKVLELGVFTNFKKDKIYDPKNPEYLERYIIEANYGIICHVLCCIFGFSVIFIYPVCFWLNFGFPVAVVNFILNLLPIFILRYNIPKLKSLYKYYSSKK